MNFFKDVVSHLIKNAFEGHAQFSVADNTAVGSNPVRNIKLDAIPVGEDTLISLAWDGGEKLFEKKLSDQESSHQFDLISTDLAEVAALTQKTEYDAAKDLMKKLTQKYAQNTGEIVDTNLPKLHNTQASIDTEAKSRQHLNKLQDADKCTECEQVKPKTQKDQIKCNKCLKDKEASKDETLWRTAKITMQNLWFSTTDELLEYQEKQKGAQGGSDQDHIPLWDKNKGGKAPGAKDQLAPPSMSYEDVENEKEKDHDDMQKHIDEKIKTELESALQQKAASVFGPDQVELVQVLRKNGRNWDEIKKILVKDFGFDKDSVNIFVDEQRQGTDPTGVDVEPIKEDVDVDVKEKSPLTPPEELVSPDTHEKLLKDHENKKKDNPSVIPEDKTFTPKDVMDIPEDDEITDESSLDNEIARADNDDIHKVALWKSRLQKVYENFESWQAYSETYGLADRLGFDSAEEAWEANPLIQGSTNPADYKRIGSKKQAAGDLNPLQEPLQEKPTTPSQDTVPMNKPLDHDAPQKGDRVFVSADLTSEKSGFEGTFISTYKSKGTDFSIVETDDGDLLDVESHRVVKTSEGSSGAQDVEPVAEPIIEMPKDDEIQVTPKMDDFHASSQKEFLTIKAEAEALLKLVKEADLDIEAESSVIMPMQYGIDDDSILQYANGSIYRNKIESGEMQDSDWQALIRETGRWMTQVGKQKVSQTFSQDADWKLDSEQINKLKSMFGVLPKASSLGTESARENSAEKCKCGHIRFDHYLKNNTQDESPDKCEGNEDSCPCKYFKKAELETEAKKEYKPCPNCGALSSSEDVCLSCLKPMKKAAADGSACIKCHKVFPLDQMVGNEHGAGYLCKADASEWNKDASLKEAGTVNWKCPKCGNSASASSVYDEKICMKDGCGTKMEKQASDFEKGISQNKTSADGCAKCKHSFYSHSSDLNGKMSCNVKDCDCKGFFVNASQNKTADEPEVAPKTQFKDYKIKPKYVPGTEAVPATPEMDEVLSKMEVLEQNLATLEAARKQIQAKMKEELAKIDQTGDRVGMEAELQASIEKAGILISAVESKVVSWKDKLYTMQTEEISYVPSVTPKEMLEKIYAKFSGAEKYVQDVLNGMLSQAKNVMQNTVIRWPNKKSSVNKEASILDDMNHYNDELLAALQELSSPL